MAIKKSELDTSLWAGCDELRGCMDASQYKDYVLVLLFVKYVSDKYAGQPFAPIAIPAGAGFADVVALKGKSDIGDRINKRILGPLGRANHLSGMAVPPTKAEQTAITVLSDMDAELAALEQRREKTHALKQAMMQELLTGRTRLV